MHSGVCCPLLEYGVILYTPYAGTLQAAGAAPDCVPDRSGMESTETRGFSGPAPWSIGQSPWWWMKCAPLIGRPGKKEQKKDAIGELVLASRLQKREERH